MDILELALANTLNYNQIDDLFGDQHHLLPFRNLNVTMGNHLQVLSEILVRNKKVQSKDELLQAVEKKVPKKHLENNIKAVKMGGELAIKELSQKMLDAAAV